MSVALHETKEFYNPAISQETAEFDDTTTWLAEALNGNMRTAFSYSPSTEGLVAQRDNRPIKKIFVDAVEETRQKNEQDQRFGFEHRRRLVELDEYEEMQTMSDDPTAPNTMIVVSDFPEELRNAGKDFGGYNTTRQQTMLRVITKDQTGMITLVSQSLDKSDREGLEAIYGRFGIMPQRGELLGQRIKINIDEKFQKQLPNVLTNIYDTKLTEKYGGEWFAGRNPTDYRNTYDFACQQTDLINVFNAGSKNLDARLGLVAAVEVRFENRTLKPNKNLGNYFGGLQFISAAAEMEFYGRLAKASGKPYSGCGMTIGGSNEELSALGYGDADKKNDSGDQFGSLEFKCKKGHNNKRPYGKLIPCCTTCGDSVKC